MADKARNVEVGNGGRPALWSLVRERAPQIAELIIDCIWPTAWPLRSTQQNGAETELRPVSAPDISVLRFSLGELQGLAAAEEDRCRAVEGKLQGVTGFSSVAASLLLAISARTVESRSFSVSPLGLAVVLGLIAYAAVQFLRAILAAITGLRRRGYVRFTSVDLAPRMGETEYCFLLRLNRELSRQIEINARVNDERVTQMELAHLAVRNAVVVLTLALVASAVLAVARVLSAEHAGPYVALLGM